jgi:hypothetical protein
MAWLSFDQDDLTSPELASSTTTAYMYVVVAFGNNKQLQCQTTRRKVVKIGLETLIPETQVAYKVTSIRNRNHLFSHTAFTPTGTPTSTESDGQPPDQPSSSPSPLPTNPEGNKVILCDVYCPRCKVSFPAPFSLRHHRCKGKRPLFCSRCGRGKAELTQAGTCAILRSIASAVDTSKSISRRWIR